MNPRPPATVIRDASQSGSVLVIVLWVAFGLVSLALYFAQSMTYELRGSEQRAAALESMQAIAGAARHVSNLLANVEEPGLPPDPEAYRWEAVPVGEARFWLIGRDPNPTGSEQPYFGLVDEASKLNLNTATAAMLEMLPWMTPEVAAAIVDWRDQDSEAGQGGAEQETYMQLNPSYFCKNSAFESPDELRLVHGMTLELLVGSDPNLNGVVEPAERTGRVAFGGNSRGGEFDAGLLEFVTVYSCESNTRTNGATRINVATGGRQEVAALLQEKFGTDRANQVMRQFTGGSTNLGMRSELEFYVRSGLSAAEYEEIERDITVASGTTIEGRVNVNTASETVLACIPGIGAELAGTVVAARQGNPTRTASAAWVTEVLGSTNLAQAGPYLTGASYVFTADIAALGRFGRGYQRVRHVFDTSGGTPRLIYRQDLAHLGWALGREVRLALEQEARQRR